MKSSRTESPRSATHASHPAPETNDGRNEVHSVFVSGTRARRNATPGYPLCPGRTLDGGIAMVRSRHLPIAESDPVPTLNGYRSLIAGYTTEILNPKTALFFLSFIPPIRVPRNGHAALQFLVFGTISVHIESRLYSV